MDYMERREENAKKEWGGKKVRLKDEYQTDSDLKDRETLIGLPREVRDRGLEFDVLGAGNIPTTEFAGDYVWVEHNGKEYNIDTMYLEKIGDK